MKRPRDRYRRVRFALRWTPEELAAWEMRRPAVYGLIERQRAERVMAARQRVGQSLGARRG